MINLTGKDLSGLARGVNMFKTVRRDEFPGRSMENSEDVAPLEAIEQGVDEVESHNNSAKDDIRKWKSDYDALLSKMKPLTARMHLLEDKHDLAPTPRGQEPKGPAEYVQVMKQIEELERAEDQMLRSRPVENSSKYTEDDWTEGRVKCSRCGKTAHGEVNGKPVCDKHADVKENAHDIVPGSGNKSAGQKGIEHRFDNLEAAFEFMRIQQASGVHCNYEVSGGKTIVTTLKNAGFAKGAEKYGTRTNSSPAQIITTGGGAQGWLIADQDGRKLYGPYPSYSAADADFKRRGLVAL